MAMHSQRRDEACKHGMSMSCLEAMADDAAVSLASKGFTSERLEPRLWEELRLKLQDNYRQATGEEHAILHVDLPDL